MTASDSCTASGVKTFGELLEISITTSCIACTAIGLVAAIVCSLSIRISLYKSVREGLGQILGTAIGAGIALTTVYFFDFGVIAVATTVLLCSVVARGLHLGEVASVNVPVTALIVIGPGISSSTAEHRLYSTLIGAAVAIVFSYFSNA